MVWIESVFFQVLFILMWPDFSNILFVPADDDQR